LALVIRMEQVSYKKTTFTYNKLSKTERKSVLL
jgi:hypothetical protein